MANSNVNNSVVNYIRNIPATVLDLLYICHTSSQYGRCKTGQVTIFLFFYYTVYKLVICNVFFFGCVLRKIGCADVHPDFTKKRMSRMSDVANIVYI